MGGLCCAEKRSNQYKKTMLNLKHLKATYNIDKIMLGEGSFGKVYKGTNKMNPKQQLAIKSIKKEFLSEAEINEIHDEVKMLQSVDHQNIVNYYETYEDSNYIYLCMELCTGGELIANFADGKMQGGSEDEKTKKIIYDLFSALSHIHSKNIIHRDIKPENIMFDQDQKDNGTVKFIDFGLACQFKKG